MRGSGALPAHAGRSVFQHDAFIGELLADGIGTGKVTCGLGRHALVDQGLDAGIVVGIAAEVEPCSRVLLQQAQGLAGTEQGRLQAGAFGRVGGLAGLAGNGGDFCQGLRGVEVIVQDL